MEETLHQVTACVAVIIRLWLLVAITAHWSDYQSSHVWDHLDQIIGLICLVGNHHLRIQALDDIGILTGGQNRT